MESAPLVLRQQFQAALEDVRQPRGPAATMVGHSVVLFAVRANLVAALPAAYLLGPQCIARLAHRARSFAVQPLFEHLVGDTPILMLVATVNLHGQAGLAMSQYNTGVGLVLVLASGSAVTRESHLDVFALEGDALVLELVHDGYRYRGGVNASATLVRWHTLPAMAAGFLPQLLEGGAPTFNRQQQSATTSLGLDHETVALRVMGVERCLDQDQRLRVVAAFGRANLDAHLHAGAPCVISRFFGCCDGWARRPAVVLVAGDGIEPPTLSL